MSPVAPNPEPKALVNSKLILSPEAISVAPLEKITGDPGKPFWNQGWLALAMSFVVLRALPILSFPPGRDQGTYLTIGEGLLQGKHLYRDLWDNKPPGIFLIYTAIARVFGRVTWSAAVVDILCLLIISVLLFRFTERYLGRGGAAVAVMVHACWHGEMGYWWIAQPETFQLICAFAGYFLMERRGRGWKVCCFAAGLSLGFAFWLKYNAIAFLPFLLAVPFLSQIGLDQTPPRLSLRLPWRQWLFRTILFGLGFGFAIGAVLAWIVLTGAWPAMKEAQFEVLPRYAAMAAQHNPDYWITLIVRTRWWIGRWTEAATLFGLVVAWRRRDLARFAPLFVAALCAYASAVMQVRLHSYYFQVCMPFFAAVWGYAAVSLFECCRDLARSFRQRGWRFASLLIWLVLANLYFWPLPDEFNKLVVRYSELETWRANPERFFANYPRALPIEHLGGQLEVIHYLRNNAQPGDGVYLWGAHCWIYYLSGQQPTTRFVSNLGLLSLWVPASWRQELIRDLNASPPRYVVVARGDEIVSITYVPWDSEQYLRQFPKLEAFITQGYSKAADFDTFLVYRRTR